MSYEPYKATFRIGARVKVVKQRKYPGVALIGLIGTVRSDSGSNVAVIFEDVHNIRSSYDCFYFKPVELIEVDENGNIMEGKNMNKVTNYLNTAKVRFVDDSSRDPGLYSFANFEADLKAGDLCVVCTERGLLRLVRVESIDESNMVEMYREVVTKVYTEEYDSRVKWREKAAELKAKMEARAKQLQDVALYKMLAEKDSDMAELLNEYQSLSQV